MNHAYREFGQHNLKLLLHASVNHVNFKLDFVRTREFHENHDCLLEWPGFGQRCNRDWHDSKRLPVTIHSRLCPKNGSGSRVSVGFAEFAGFEVHGWPA